MSEQDLTVPRPLPATSADTADEPGAAARVLGAPSLVAQDVHVTYRVVGSRGRERGAKSGGGRRARLRRLMDRGREHTGGVTEVHAVRGVSFVARRGESIAILGTNGSGKSTLLRALAGLQPMSQGSVYVDGVPSLLGVNAVLMKKLSGERNIVIGGLALGLTRAEIDAKLDEIVEFAGIGDAVYLPMSALSSGMAARLRFAISTARVPEVLMIDEALATGDAAFRQRSKERIEQIREAAGTIFFVSHSLAAVRSMCTRAIWLDKGVVRMDGDVDTVADAYRDHIKADKREARRARRAKLGEEEWQRRRQARRARREARRSAEAAESR